MIDLRTLLALTLAATAPFMAACSSSGGGASAVEASDSEPDACPPALPACSACIHSSCSALASAELGPSWYPSGPYGGVCGAWMTCLAKCGCGDSACSAACPTTTECMNASAATSACGAQMCFTQCSDAPSDSGASPAFSVDAGG
jgi:hypothetical protein